MSTEIMAPCAVCGKETRTMTVDERGIKRYVDRYWCLKCSEEYKNYYLDGGNLL